MHLYPALPQCDYSFCQLMFPLNFELHLTLKLSKFMKSSSKLSKDSTQKQSNSYETRTQKQLTD